MWLRELVSGGHQVRVLCAAWGDVAETVVDGIAVRSVKNLALHTGVLADEIRAFRPDLVLVSSEDLSHRLVREAARLSKVIYLAHTPQFFPFGPESWNANAEASKAIRSAAAVVAIGKHMAGYIEQHAGMKATVIHPPIYGDAPFPQFGDFESGDVLMINPCAVKGISIFLGLAELLPHQQFTALTGWGTTQEDRRRLAALPNVRVLGSVGRIDEVLRGARLLLMPSLWYEGFGLIAMEAMLRGLPVVASDSGGLKEAKAGTDFVIPVNAIARYLPEFDEVHMPVPVLPEQAVEPWVAALRQLSTENVVYEREAEHSRAHALDFVARLEPGALTRLCESC